MASSDFCADTRRLAGLAGLRVGLSLGFKRMGLSPMNLPASLAAAVPDKTLRCLRFLGVRHALIELAKLRPWVRRKP
jgi:hypothetical protein